MSRRPWRARSQLPHRSDAIPSLESCACCRVQRCQDSGCSVVLPTDRLPRLVLSGTRYQQNHSLTTPLADFCVFAWSRRENLLYFYILELKAGRIDVRKVVEQLQGGADLGDKMVGSDQRVLLVPTLVYGSGIGSIER